MMNLSPASMFITILLSVINLKNTYFYRFFIQAIFYLHTLN